MTEPLNDELTTAEIALKNPGSIPVFERHAIDYCCNGTRSLREAARAAGTQLEDLLTELGAVTGPAGEKDMSGASLSELIDHILETHHVYTKQALEDLPRQLEKVVRVHGENHAFLTELYTVFMDLARELTLHLRKEEEILFPMLRNLVQTEESNSFTMPACGPEAPMQVMELEHDHAGEALRHLRTLTGEYTPPPGACTTFRALYVGLEQLEGDLHRHIHLENNLLHPMARGLLDAQRTRLSG